MPIKPILGRIEFTQMRPQKLNSIKKEILSKNGINKADLSNYKGGRFNKISKKKLKFMKLIIENKIVKADKFLPMNNNKIENCEYIIILRGFENDLSGMRERL